jgi:hypothetical protein
MFLLLARQNLAPPIRRGCGDPSSRAEALAGWYPTVHRAGRQAVQKLRARPAASLLPLHLPLPNVRSPVPPSKGRAAWGAQAGLRSTMNSVKVRRRGGWHRLRIGIVVRPTTGLRPSPCAARMVKRGGTGGQCGWQGRGRGRRVDGEDLRVHVLVIWDLNDDQRLILRWRRRGHCRGLWWRLKDGGSRHQRPGLAESYSRAWPRIREARSTSSRRLQWQRRAATGGACRHGTMARRQ